MIKTVFIVNDFCFIKGGASRVAIEEAVALAARGYQVCFFGAVGPVGSELQGVPNLRVVCLEQEEIMNAGYNPSIIFQGLWNTKAFRRMNAELASQSPSSTVIHLHGFSKALTGSVTRAAIGKKFQVICTLHDYFTACPNGGFFDYRACVACQRRGLSFSCLKANCDKRHYAHKLYRILKAAVQKYVGGLPGRIQHYIYLSESSLTLLQPYLPRNANLYYLENINQMERKPPCAPGNNKDFVFVGQLDPHKGIRPLLDAAQKTNTSVLFVGEGPMRQEIEAMGHRVTGWVSRTTVSKEMQKARALVFPSLWCETYGLVVAEAAAQGIPSLVTDITAAAERVEDGRSGWVCKTGDVNDFGRCLTAAKDDQLVAAYGAAAYEKFWQAPPSQERHIDALVKIYELSLNEK